MNNKLVSLAERPATKNDIGKTYWKYDHNNIPEQFTINGFTDGGFMLVKSELTREHEVWNETPFKFWNKPILVSQEEYEQLKQGQIKGYCKDCDKCDEYHICHIDTSVPVCKKGSVDYCSHFRPKSEPTADKVSE